MKYLNSATQLPQDAVGYWMQTQNPTDIDHLRIKTGYFSLNGLSSFKAIIDSLNANQRAISAVIGANGKDTLQSDVDGLIDLVQHPRSNTRIAVSGFSNGLFHPKVYHLTRTDGSQLAYVGSANLTPAGITGLNVEVGILLDTRDGDDPAVLATIASSVDNWFSATLLTQTNVIATKADTTRLVADGLLGVTSQPRLSTTPPTSGKSRRPSLKPLVNAPSITAPAQAPSIVPAQQTAPPLPANPLAQPQQANVGTPTNDVLVAEIGGGDRWKQANFPKSVIQTFFGVNPLAKQHISLIPVDVSGVASPPISTLVGHVKSQNYRVELTTVNGIAYPTNGRPIGVFRKMGISDFRYHVYLPGSSSHGALDGFLNSRYTGPQRELKRVIANQSDILVLNPPIQV